MNDIHALIIDDNPYNVEILASMLEMEGVDSTQVFEPKRLGDVLPAMPHPAVIFLDIEMPGMDGYAVLDTLRQQPRFNDTPIVAYSVHHNELHKARKKGFNSFIAKPLDADRFPTQLGRILHGEQVWATE
jgi:CheY-like chemotaxis protein